MATTRRCRRLENEYIRTDEVTEVCLLAGKIMLQNGAETYRVEDTMTRIAAAFGILHSHSFVTPTGIIFSIDSSETTRLIRVSERFTNLEKVAVVNDISRKISEKKLTVQDACERLKEVEKTKYSFPVWVQIIAAALASGCFLIMFQGKWIDFLPAVITGGVGFCALLYFQYLVEIKFFAEFVSAFIIGLLAFLLVMSGFGHEIDKIIIGAVMPLVPGLLITNAVRDLMAGHLVSGISKGAEACLTAFAIGTGIAVVFSII